MAKTLPPDLVLLGVIHHDPMGYKRTGDFLSRYRPDLVLVEISPFGLRYRELNARRLYRVFRQNLRAAAKRAGIAFRVAITNPTITRIGRQLHLPFEYRASAAYCARTAAQVVPVDWSDFSSQWIATWPELISPENLETLLRLEEKSLSIPANYDLAARAILGGRSAQEPLDPDEVLPGHQREEHIASEILARLESSAPDRPLYIGGWRHLISGGTFRTLRDILGIGLSGCFLLDRGPLFTQGRDEQDL